MLYLSKHALQKYLNFALTVILSFSCLAIPEQNYANANDSTPTSTNSTISTNAPSSIRTPTSTNCPTSTIIPTSISTPTPKATPTAVEPTPGKIPSSNYFKDIANHWAKKYISALILNNIINGYSDGTIRPDNYITRAEIAVILAKTLKLEINNTNVNAFKDYKIIPEWSLSYVNQLNEKGIINGYEDGTFKPNNKVTRAELVTMVMKTFEQKSIANKKFIFFDSRLIPEWANGYIAAGIETGIIKGYTDNTFKPLNKIKRAEVFAIIARCIEQFQ